jgi:hypothetical protein
MTETPWFVFILALLATWRASHLIAAEDGPGNVVLRLRARLGRSFLGQLMDCFGCVSLWVAAPFAFFVASRPFELVVVWLALSGGAMLIERIKLEPIVVEKPTQGDQDHELLR